MTKDLVHGHGLIWTQSMFVNNRCLKQNTIPNVNQLNILTQSYHLKHTDEGVATARWVPAIDTCFNLKRLNKENALALAIPHLW